MAEVALKELSVDSSVRMLEKLREKWVRDQRSALKEAELKGIEKGRMEGRQEGWQAGRMEGRQEGQQEGIQQGVQQERQQVVLNMLKSGIGLSIISEVTGLSQEEINKLKNGS